MKQRAERTPIRAPSRPLCFLSRRSVYIAMKENPHLRFRRGDLLAIALVLLLAVGTAAAFRPDSAAPENALVQIWQEGSLLAELPLDSDAERTVHGAYANTVAVRAGKAAIVSSDCPGADCVHSGWISAPGRSIVCLPNKVELRIVGAQSDIDFVVR